MPDREFVNLWYTELDGAIADTDIQMTVLAAPNWDGVTPFYAALRDGDGPLSTVELILVTGMNGLVLDITRAQEDTTAENWADGTLVRSTITAESLNNLTEVSRTAAFGYGTPVLWGDASGLAPTWASSTAYTKGDFVKESGSAAEPNRVWRCLVSGNSDVAEPDWDDDPMVDGTVEWESINEWSALEGQEYGWLIQPTVFTGHAYSASHDGRTGQYEPYWQGRNEVKDSVMASVFLTTGTWDVESRGASTRIICIGAGGGGASGRKGAAASARVGGGGGGGGGWSDVTFATTDLDPTSPWDVFVGTGGAGGAAQATSDTNGNNGSAGGDSYVGATVTTALVIAKGGAGGTGGGSGAGGTGGAGGAGMIPGGTGDTADVAGGAGTGGVRQTAFVPGGAAGGGISSGNAASAGGAGNIGAAHGLPFPTAGAINSAGNAGVTPGTTAHSAVPGSSGSGGGSSTSGAGGAGGAGVRGSGGAGGGAAVNAVGNSGAGGAGGDGIVVIITLT